MTRCTTHEPLLGLRPRKKLEYQVLLTSMKVDALAFEPGDAAPLAMDDSSTSTSIAMAEYCLTR